MRLWRARCVRNFAAAAAQNDARIATAIAPTSAGGDFRAFFDLLLLPSRSPAGAQHEALRALPVTSDAFFADGRRRTAANYMTLLRAQALRRDGLGAQRTLAEMRADKSLALGLLHYNHVLAAVARAGDAEAFDRIHAEMLAAGVGLGDSHTFSCAATCYMRAGDVARALAVVKRAKDAGVQPDEILYGALLTGFAQRGDYKNADAVWTYLNSSNGPKLDSVLYTAMIHACARAGQGEKALMLLSEMQSEGVLPTDVTFNAVLLATARRLDMWRDTKALFASMQASGVHVSEYTMNTMLLCAARAGDADSCRRVVADMVARGLGVTRITLNTQLNGLARALQHAPSQGKGALLAEAEALYSRIENGFGGADLHTQSARLNVYVSGHYLERCTAWFAHMQQQHGGNLPLHVWTSMLKLWCVARRPERLRDTLLAMHAASVELDGVAYKWAVEGFARAYWVKTAVQLVGAMVDAGIEPDARHLRLLRQRCREHDLRQHRRDLEDVVQRWESGREQRRRRQLNAQAAMQNTLAGGDSSMFAPFRE